MAGAQLSEAPVEEAEHEENPAQPLPLANLAQIFLASSGTAP